MVNHMKKYWQHCQHLNISGRFAASIEGPPQFATCPMDMMRTSETKIGREYWLAVPFGNTCKYVSHTQLLHWESGTLRTLIRNGHSSQVSSHGWYTRMALLCCPDGTPPAYNSVVVGCADSRCFQVFNGVQLWTMARAPQIAIAAGRPHICGWKVYTATLWM